MKFINDLFKSQAEKIASCYNIEKSEELDIEKGGEGSRGGKVIGHTKSGKAVYFHNAYNEKHANFTSDDHEDAAKLHRENSAKYREKSKSNNSIKDHHKMELHDQFAREHDKEANKKSIEKSEDGLEIAFEVQTEEKLENVGRLKEQVLYLLNEQIRNEFQSSFIYRETSAWLDDNGWIGGSKLFAKYADEELDHAKKIYQYIFEKNCKAATPSDLGNIELFYTDIKDLVSKALEHEMQVTADWNMIASVAKDLDDHDTYGFALTFVKEQTEEEEKFRNILFKINLDMPKYEIDELFEDNLTKSEETNIEKGGFGSGRHIGQTKSGKDIPRFQKHPDDFKEWSKEDHENASDSHFKMSNKYKNVRGGYDMFQHHAKQGSFHKKIASELEKSQDLDIEKGRKAVVIGTKSKDGKYVKTSKGWEKVKQESNVQNKPSGSAALGSFKDLSHDELSKLDSLAKQAKDKNKEGKVLTNEEQHAMDHHSDIESELGKKKINNFDHTFFDDYKLSSKERDLILKIKNGEKPISDLYDLHDSSENIDENARKFIRKVVDL